MKSLLIGSHPKGYLEPFHPETHSGRILRKLIGDRVETFVFFDLWADEIEQKSNTLTTKTRLELSKHIACGYRLIALGRVVQKALSTYDFPYTCLPHPASRRNNDRKILAKYFQI